MRVKSTSLINSFCSLTDAVEARSSGIYGAPRIFAVSQGTTGTKIDSNKKEPLESQDSKGE